MRLFTEEFLKNEKFSSLKGNLLKILLLSLSVCTEIFALVSLFGNPRLTFCLLHPVRAGSMPTSDFNHLLKSLAFGKYFLVKRMTNNCLSLLRVLHLKALLSLLRMFMVWEKSTDVENIQILAFIGLNLMTRHWMSLSLAFLKYLVVST